MVLQRSFCSLLRLLLGSTLSVDIAPAVSYTANLGTIRTLYKRSGIPTPRNPDTPLNDDRLVGPRVLHPFESNYSSWSLVDFDSICCSQVLGDHQLGPILIHQLRLITTLDASLLLIRATKDRTLSKQNDCSGMGQTPTVLREKH